MKPFNFAALLAPFFLSVVLLLAGCAKLPTIAPHPNVPSPVNPQFKVPDQSKSSTFATKEELARIEEIINPPYEIGRGDGVSLDVFGRPEVSGKHTVGPDGKITVPIVGDIEIGDMTRDAAMSVVNQKLRAYYSNPVATLAVTDYISNQVTVLGRVQTAGAQRFTHPPTLAEVLANAGAMPILDKTATLTRCAIMRGRDTLIWVDLKALLTGDVQYNIRLKKGDIVYVPDSSDTAVYILGAVTKPGSLRLTPRMTVLDALAQAGGPTVDAENQLIGLYRAGAEQVEVLQLAEIIDPSRKMNYALEDGDVLYVANSGVADFGYAVAKLSPFIAALSFGLLILKY